MLSDSSILLNDVRTTFIHLCSQTFNTNYFYTPRICFISG